jgi:DtxR family transcriptional regulator, Mn-dependent transcriptional regulator
MNRSLEDILEAVWRADEQGDQSVAAIRSLCPDEIAEEDIELLVERGLVARQGDDLYLTDAGRVEGTGVIRRHRLVEVLFATILNLDAQKRDEIACEVEHSLLPEMEEAICTLLGHPQVSPTGMPIPSGHCCSAGMTVASTVVKNLTQLEPGETGRITYIKPKHHARLHRLSSFGLTPGTVIELHQRFPSYCIRYEGTELAVNKDVAEDIFVAKIEK